MSLFPGLIPRKDRNPTNRKSSTAGTWPMGSATKVRCTPTPDRLPSGKNGYRVTQTGRTTRVRQVSTAMTKTDADCFRLLPDRRLGSFHRLRDFDDRGPRSRMGFELPQILFSPWFADSGFLFRHVFHSSL